MHVGRAKIIERLSKISRLGGYSSKSSPFMRHLYFIGPGAALIIGYVTYYRYENTNVEVEYEITCDNGQHRKQRSKASLKLDRYSQTHFVQKHGAFYSRHNCDHESNDCIRSLNGKKALAPIQLITDFERCVKMANMKTILRTTIGTAAIITTPKTTTTRRKPNSVVGTEAIKTNSHSKDNNRDRLLVGSAASTIHTIPNIIKCVVLFLLTIDINLYLAL